MILILQKIVGNIPFSEAVRLSCDDTQRYIKCSNFFDTTYIQIKKDDNKLQFRFVEISKNLDIIDTGPWSEFMNINDVLNTNWSIYMATIA